eukprot:UC4_evm1s1225
MDEPSSKLLETDVKALLAHKFEVLCTARPSTTQHENGRLRSRRCVYPDARDTTGKSILHFALAAGDPRLVKILLNPPHNADPNPKDKNLFTPAAFAATTQISSDENSISVALSALAESSCNLDTRDLYGLGPIHKASGMGKSVVVSKLIQLGVPADARTSQVTAPHQFRAEPSLNETPLHIAARGGKHDVIRVLCELGANVNAKNYDGDSPLHVSARVGSWGAALLLRGSHHDAENNRGQTPRDVALDHGRGVFAMMLRFKLFDLLPAFMVDYLPTGDANMHR